MVFRRFFEESLAHASYLLGCPESGEALVIDPHRDIQRYLDAAEDEDLKIKWIIETHIHADYVSGSRDLARATGAPLMLSGEGGPEWSYRFPHDRTVRDGDTFRVGSMRFDVLHTPGHTPEHISLLMTDERAGNVPLALFSGDFLFCGDVGRPDLLESAAGVAGTKEPAARALYQSLIRIRELPAHVLVCPAHGAGSACGKALGGMPMSSLGYEAATNWAFQCPDEGTFVDAVLAGQPDPPPYFAAMKRVNRDGPQPLPTTPVERLSLPPAEAWVLDVRPSREYRAGHPAGVLHIPAQSLLRWGGWLIPVDTEVVLLANSADEAEAARRRLSMIGIDQVRGWLSIDAFAEVRATKVASTLDHLAERHVIDVRDDPEWAAGHLPGAHHIPMAKLENRTEEIPEGPIGVHCRSGGRASVAVSILERAGQTDVVWVETPIADLLADLE